MLFLIHAAKVSTGAVFKFMFLDGSLSYSLSKISGPYFEQWRQIMDGYDDKYQVFEIDSISDFINNHTAPHKSVQWDGTNDKSLSEPLNNKGITEAPIPAYYSTIFEKKSIVKGDVYTKFVGV